MYIPCPGDLVCARPRENGTGPPRYLRLKPEFFIDDDEFGTVPISADELMLVIGVIRADLGGHWLLALRHHARSRGVEIGWLNYVEITRYDDDGTEP